MSPKVRCMCWLAVYTLALVCFLSPQHQVAPVSGIIPYDHHHSVRITENRSVVNNHQRHNIIMSSDTEIAFQFISFVLRWVFRSKMKSNKA